MVQMHHHEQDKVFVLNSKESIKKRLGKSPDIFDSVLMGFLQFEARGRMEWEGIHKSVYLQLEDYELERLFAHMPKTDRDTVIEAWIDCWMFIGVPFVFGYIMAAKVATVYLSAYARYFGRFIYIGAKQIDGIIKNSHGIKGERRVSGVDSLFRDCQCLITTVPAVTRQLILIFERLPQHIDSATVCH